MSVDKYKDFNFKLEYIKFSISLLLTVITLLIVVFLLSTNYNPDISVPLKMASDILLRPQGAQPEPKEKSIFMACVVIGVLSLFGYFALLNNYFNKKSSKNNDNLYYLLLVLNICFFLFVTYKCFLAPNPYASSPQNSHDIIGKTNFDFYFIKSFIYKKTFVYFFVLYPLITTLFLFKFNISQRSKDNFNKFSSKFSFIFCITLSLLTIGFCAFKFPYTWENKHDFNAVFYSLVQVYNGFPLLVDNFTNTYGLYPHFLMPILKLTGLSILSFTSIMGIMLCCCFCFIYYFLNKLVQNKWIVLFGFSAVFYLCYFYSKVVMSYDPGFAMHPIRWFFPTLLIAFSAFYVSFIHKNNNSFFVNTNNKILQLFNINMLKTISYFVFSFGILWSPDFGSLTYLSLIAFFIFIDFNFFELKKSILRTIANVVLAVLMIVLVFFIYSCIIKLTYGKYPSLPLMFSAIFGFSVVGYYMLPISDTWHPWMLIVLVYLIGWLVSISNLINNKKTLVTISIFTLTFLGTLSLTYFQGRSHNWNLFVTNSEFFLLITIFANELYILTEKYPSSKATFALALFLIAFTPFQIVADSGEIKKLLFTENDKRQNKNEQNKIIKTANIIDVLCQDKEKIFILSADMYQSLYHSFSHTSSFVNPGFIDMLTKKQYDHVVDKLKKVNPKIFFEPHLFRPLNSKILNVLGSYYTLESNINAPDLYYYNKKKVDKSSVLDTSENVLFYNNFNVDFNKNLMLYEGNTPKINLPDQFSIEIIFKPTSNLMTDLNRNATLLSNFDEPKGFVIQQYGDKANQFLLANKSGGITCNVSLEEWNYLVFEVNREHIKCFVNGRLQNEITMKEPFENSNSPLYIGSMKNQGAYFFGNIKEIKISKEFPNDVEITNNWNNVSKL